MSKIRLIMLSLLAVFAVSAVASASASAALCKEEPGKKLFTLCLGKELTLAEGEFNVDITSVGKTTLTASEIEIPCEKILPLLVLLDSLGGVVKILPFKIHFVECTVTKPAHCVVEPSSTEKGLILTLELDGIVKPGGEILFLPVSGSHFTTIVLKSSGGTCTIAGSDEVTSEGKKAEVGPLCFLHEIEKTVKLHLLLCEKGKSHLEFIKKPAEFIGTFSTILLLEEKIEDEWAIIEGL